MSGSVTRTLGTSGEGGFTSATISSDSDTVELGDVTCDEEWELFLSKLVLWPLLVLVRDLVLLLGLWDALGDGGRSDVAWDGEGGGGGANDGCDGGGGGGTVLGDGNCSLILHLPLELAVRIKTILK